MERNRGIGSLGVLVIAVWISLPGAGRVQAEERQKMAVLDLRAEGEISQDLLTVLNETLLVELHQVGNYSVLGRSDISAMLGFEEQRRLFTECLEDRCLVEIGGALGVALVTTGWVGVVGDKYVLTLKVLDVPRALVLRRTSESSEKDPGRLLEALHSAVRQVVTEQAVEALQDRVDTRRISHVLPQVIRDYESHTATWRTLAWTFTGLSAASAAAATGLFIWNQGRLSDYERDRTAADAKQHADELNQRADSINLVDSVTMGLAIGAGVSAGLALYFWLTGDPPGGIEEPTPPRAARLGPGPAPLGLTLSLDF